MKQQSSKFTHLRGMTRQEKKCLHAKQGDSHPIWPNQYFSAIGAATIQLVTPTFKCWMITSYHQTFCDVDSDRFCVSQHREPCATPGMCCTYAGSTSTELLYCCASADRSMPLRDHTWRWRSSHQFGCCGQCAMFIRFKGKTSSYCFDYYLSASEVGMLMLIELTLDD